MAKEMENEIKLQPTYGNFELRGIIQSIEEVKEGQTGAGADYKSLKVQIATDENSSIKVDFFGMKREEIEVVKFKGKTVERQKVKWAKRNSLPEGFQLSNFGSVGLGFDIKDAKTKGGIKYFVSYDAIDKIVENFVEGDSVKVNGSIGFSPYVSQNSGQELVMTNYTVSRMYKIDEINFAEEEYQPYVKFDQQVVVVGSEKVNDFGEDKVNALLLDCIVITSKKGDFVNQEFVVLADKRPNLAKNLSKLSAYTLITLKGNIINQALVDETASSEDDGWGFDDQQKAVKGFERYFEILAADNTTMEEGKYTDDDFIKEDYIDEEEEEKPSKTKKAAVKKNEEEDEIFEGEDDSEYLDDMDNWLAEEEE